MLIGCGGGESNDDTDDQPKGGNNNKAGSGSVDNPTAGSGNSTAGTDSGAGTGTGGSGGSDNPTPSSCDPSPEDCTAASEPGLLPVADFDVDMGWWLFANPDDPAGTTTPEAGANVATEEISCPTSGVCGASVLAMHVQGGGFTTYGPSLSHDFVYPDASGTGYTGEPVDASTYSGIMFWARRGDGMGLAPTIGITVNDVSSHPAGEVCDAMATPGAMGSEACFDGWWAQKPLTAKWTLVKIPFAMLKQQGFGKEVEALQPDKIYGISFNLPMQKFDFWISDVSFYK
jgi:hypothetical protein